MPWGTFPQLLGSRPEAVMCHPRPGSMVTPPFPSSPMFVTLITLYSSPAGHLLVPWMCCFFFLGGSVCVHPSHLTYSSGLSRGACVDVAGLVRSRWHVALTSRTLLFCMSIGIKPCFIVVGFIVVQFIVLRRYCVFLRIEGLWQQHWASLLVPFFQQYLLTSCLSHFGNSPTLFVLVACGQWSLMLLLSLLCPPPNHTHVRRQLNKCVRWPFHPPAIPVSSSRQASLFPETQ